MGVCIQMTTTSQAREPILSMRQITKRFPNVVANDSVDLDLYPGEVHALLGENGAGKSTLMKILYGFYSADRGSISLNGRQVQISSPLEARRNQIGMVFQTFTLIPAMTVAENIALYLPDLPIVLDHQKIVSQIEDLGKRHGLYVNPHLLVRDISLGDQQKVEVLKLLVGNARILIFDEATRALPPHEIEGLFEIFESLKADGHAIIFITHKMREVMQCADRISVLRQGRMIKTISRLEASEALLVSMMFGDSVPQETSRPTKVHEDTRANLIELKNVSTPTTAAGVQLTNINLQIKSGEIVGVAGVSGNGQRELVDVILGHMPFSKGARFVQGMDCTDWDAGRIRDSGVAFIPEDPLKMGVVPWMDIIQNTALGNIEAYAEYGGLAIDWDRVRSDIEGSFARLSFDPLNLYVPVRTLSGGQLQRMVLARELSRNPKTLIASYPTRGLDVHSAMATCQVLSDLRDAGGGVLLISEDLDELYELCDRLVVLYQGEVVGDFEPHEIDRYSIGHLMTGSGRSRETA